MTARDCLQPFGLKPVTVADAGHVQALTLVQDGPSEWQAQTP